MELLIAVIVTYISINYLTPILDICFEWFKYYITNKATTLQLLAQKQVKEFEKQYPEEIQRVDAVGFHMSPSESLLEDDEEIEDNVSNKMGFHK